MACSTATSHLKLPVVFFSRLSKTIRQLDSGKTPLPMAFSLLSLFLFLLDLDEVFSVGSPLVWAFLFFPPSN